MKIRVEASDLLGLKDPDAGVRRKAFEKAGAITTSLMALVLDEMGSPFSSLTIPVLQPPKFKFKTEPSKRWAEVSLGGVSFMCGVYGSSEKSGAPCIFLRIILKLPTRWQDGLLAQNKGLVEEIKKVCASDHRWELLYQKRSKKPTLESAHNYNFGEYFLLADGSWTSAELDSNSLKPILDACRQLCLLCAEQHMTQARARYVNLLQRMPATKASPGKGTGLLLERQEVVDALSVAISTRKLVLLAGVSGSGKTQLACRFAAARGSGEMDLTALSADQEGTTASRLHSALVEAKVIEDANDGWVRILPLKPEAAIIEDLEDDDGEEDETESDSEDDESGEEDSESEGAENEGIDSQQETAQPLVRGWELVPVRPDWQEAASLWGWRENKQFHGTPALRLVLDAWTKWTKSHENREERTPVSHVLVLDEMNLSRIEHYGSDLLSAMERPGDPIIRLHDAGTSLPLAGSPGVKVPSQIGWPPGLCVVGTVNVDETTFSFAPKVLDRACVLEFLDIDLERAFGIRTRDSDWKALRPWLDSVQEALTPHSLHLGYRAAFEIADLARSHLGEDAGTWNDSEDFDGFLDGMLRNKVLPRVRGSGAQIQPVLLALLAVAMGGLAPENRKNAKEKCEKSGDNIAELRNDSPTWTYPTAGLKCLSMLAKVGGTGFASFF